MMATIRPRIPQSNTRALLLPIYTFPHNLEMETQYARWLRDLMKRHGVSQYALARSSGVKQPTIQRILSGETQNPKAETLRQLAASVNETYDLQATWHAPTPPVGATEPDRLRPVPPHTRRIPVISYIHAGHPVEAVDAYLQGDGFGEIAVDADLAQVLGHYAFALAVEGNSMAPEYQPGDVVVIDPESPVRPGDAVVAKLDADDAATLKKYRDRGRAADGTPIIELVPLNDDYPTIVMDAGNPGRLIGPVIEHRRRRR